MTEETKKSSCGCGGGLKSLVKILLGVALIVVGGFLCGRWFSPLVQLIKGCLGPLVILIGLVFVAIAKE